MTRRLKAARTELEVLDHQLVVFAEDADELRLRAIVSDVPAHDERSAIDAERHAIATRRSRDLLMTEITDLQRTQDELLDQLVVGPR
ncbi:MAG TPA: hypothetical protein VMY34_09790 [Acidimicrobiales bacterium]|nr:hypothetical protein [Acidimicrobiales bacterium]